STTNPTAALAEVIGLAEKGENKNHSRIYVPVIMFDKGKSEISEGRDEHIHPCENALSCSMGFPKESDIQRTANEEVSDIGITNVLNNRCAHQQEYQPVVHLLWCARIRKVDITAAVVASCAKAVPSRFKDILDPVPILDIRRHKYEDTKQEKTKNHFSLATLL
ncbi:hypothetical protein Tco_0578555, partial [Tanacetum coccineum]